MMFEASALLAHPGEDGNCTRDCCWSLSNLVLSTISVVWNVLSSVDDETSGDKHRIGDCEARSSLSNKSMTASCLTGLSWSSIAFTGVWFAGKVLDVASGVGVNPAISGSAGFGSSSSSNRNTPESSLPGLRSRCFGTIGSTLSASLATASLLRRDNCASSCFALFQKANDGIV